MYAVDRIGGRWRVVRDGAPGEAEYPSEESARAAVQEMLKKGTVLEFTRKQGKFGTVPARNKAAQPVLAAHGAEKATTE